MNIEKFQYLKTCLAGTPKRAIDGIRLTDANYKIAVNVLTETYGRQGFLIDDHIDSLLSIKEIESSYQVSHKRDLYGQIQFRTGCLDSHCMPSAEYAVVLHRVLMHSLPDDLAMQHRKRTKTVTAGADSAADNENSKSRPS